jgi:hypothetical protein
VATARSPSPTSTAQAAAGSTLSCSQGSWAPDLLGSFLYRAPQSFSYQWSLNGADIAGASAASDTAVVGGDYRCTATASNQAGLSAAQTSDPFTVQNEAAPSNSFTEGRPKLNKKKGTGTLPVNVPGPGTLTLSGQGLVPQRTARTTAAAAKTVGAAGTVKLLVKAKGKTKKKLNKSGKAKVRVTVTFTPTGGAAASKTKSITLIKRR